MARRSRNQTTTLTPSPKSADEILAFYNQCAKDIHEIEQRRNSSLQGDLGALFVAFPALDSVVLRGYTPGFNDGDPCYHHTCEPIVNGRDPDEYDDEDEEEGAEPVPSKLSKEDEEAIRVILSGMDDAVHDIYDTNYEVTVTRTADGITLANDHYDCGY